MRISFDLKKRYMYTALLVSALLVVTTIAVAYGTSSPTVFGHSAGEINLGDIIKIRTGSSEMVEIRADNGVPRVLLRDSDASVGGERPYIGFVNSNSTDVDARIRLIDDNSLQVENANLVVASGKSLCLGSDCKSAWPSISISHGACRWIDMINPAIGQWGTVTCASDEFAAGIGGKSSGTSITGLRVYCCKLA